MRCYAATPCKCNSRPHGRSSCHPWEKLASSWSRATAWWCTPRDPIMRSSMAAVERLTGKDSERLSPIESSTNCGFFRGIKSKKNREINSSHVLQKVELPSGNQTTQKHISIHFSYRTFWDKKNHLYAAIFHQAMFDFQRLPGLVNVATSLWKITMLYHAI